MAAASATLPRMDACRAPTGLPARVSPTRVCAMLSNRSDDCRSCLLFACRAKVRSIAMSSRTLATSVSPPAASRRAADPPGPVLRANGVTRRCPSTRAESRRSGPGGGAVVTLSSSLLPQHASTPLKGVDGSAVERDAGSGAQQARGGPSGALQIVGCSRTVPTLPFDSGVALARVGVHVAVARWREVHRPLLAVGSDTVARHVPRCSEGMQVTAHPFPDPPLAEWFH